MAHRVVCLSGPDGAQMREVARGVAEGLGFALVDEEIIAQAAAAAGVEPEAVADVEKRRSFIARAIDELAAGGDISALGFAGAGPVAPETPKSGELRGLIRTAIEELAGRGDVVIAAHAASHALASRPDVLRILVTASLPTRVERVSSELELSETDATRRLDRSDAARADYLKRFYDTRRELPTQYDLVVNTDRLTIDDAVSLVVSLAAER